MIQLSNLSLRTRLWSSLSLLGAAAALVGAIGIYGNQQAVNTTEAIFESNVVPMADLATAASLLAEHGRDIYRHIITTDEAESTALARNLERNADKLPKALDRFHAGESSDEERAMGKAYEAALAQYLAQSKEVLTLSTASRDKEALALANGAMSQALQNTDKLLDQLVAMNIQQAEAARTAASADAAMTLRLVLTVLAAALLAVVAISLLLTRSVMRQLGADPLRLNQVVHRLGEGDLQSSVAAPGRAEGSVLGALATMQARWRQVVLDVRRNSDSVSIAATQIAQGNQDLSQRTEEQASALQQTSASMEALAQTVRNNADNASQANQLAQSASDVAVQGGQVVGQVVETMKGINDSSKRIADIIAVIDGIAFQTNILALNAAVEAARAGEQGRGFAVVASEVRSLAQRSAEAAKEIKALIHASVERVEQGSNLVDRAGATMQEVVNSIRRVTDIIGDINRASTEQSAGVAQVGNAVSQMDQATQQNAALVEQSAAAAESLKQQADALVRTVAVFRLADDTRNQDWAAARAP